MHECADTFVYLSLFTVPFNLYFECECEEQPKKKKCVIKNQWVNVYVRRQIVYTNNEF